LLLPRKGGNRVASGAMGGGNLVSRVKSRREGWAGRAATVGGGGSSKGGEGAEWVNDCVTG